ncbi:PREDICTED: ankyrin repeat and sterile alpha motif domain-containing protein 1B isoform X2 [Hipposideros armiger]|uniref:Ankyrin repeat and sterile alpha motif domain-containing protein 1B isoform X2 n=1 Tax=Hipposideros armiger TaxID=186990 RepID=A0A8B7R976_HIPAR|nr:PREDICTED: ankyrin repeat and sterile alpha motif domain-containing protein 1B isoform X2 [Hipposideros armiger]
MIISAHPNLMSCNTRKHTPLHLAARNGHKAVVQVLLEAGMDVSCQTEKGSALHEAALFGKVDVVRVLLETGIDANIKDSLGRTVLDILKEHPSQKSLQIATLLQEYVEGVGRPIVLEEHVQEDTTQETHISSPVESPSQKTKSETVTGELSKLLDEIKLCQEKDYSFEDLCHTISDHYLDNLSKISEEELGKNGSQSVRTSSTINLSPGEVEEEDDDENTCGPSGLWEALTPCNGCRNLGFPILAQESYPKKRNYTMEIIPSASLDTFSSENENFLCDLTDTAVTKKPCSLEIARAPSPRTDNTSEVAITAPGTSNHRNSSTGPTPDCSPPSPDTALKNIVKVIRPQPKQRTSIVSSLDFHRMNHNQEYFEINTSTGCSSFPSSPPASPHTSSAGITEVKNEGTGRTDDLSQQEDSDPPKEYDPGQFAGLLHGSSPACESPENPFHLYRKRDEHEGHAEVTLSNSPLPFKQSPIENSSEPVVKKVKPKVVSRTIFHKKSNPLENHTIVGTRTTRSGSRNGDQWIVNTGGFVERACTLGRIRSLPKALIDMHLSKTVSKSDSDLITYPSNEKTSRVNWSESSTAEHSSKGNSERAPSFTSEWEEIDKIMSSIDVGINSGLEEMNGETARPRCPVQTVGQWLESIGLPQYENHLMANGFDNVQFMGSNVMEDQDLLEIGILNSGHRQRILQAIQLLPKMRPIGHDGYHPTSVAEWLDSIELGDYTKAFLINGYTSMDLLKKIWEVELINVLKINLIGHRKRILASLGDRLHEDPPQKPPRSITLRGDARRRRNENYFDDIPRSKLERQMAQQSSVCEIWTNQNAGFPFSAIHQVHNTGDWGEPSITLRPPNEATASTPVQYWQHHPEKLIFQSCDYKAFYLGSMLIKELRGTESTQDACAKMRANCQKSTEQMKKVPTIILSVSYKGVKFIDATNKNIIAEHEIRNISCAAQDPEDLSTFAYITKDLKSNHHYCHVFTAFDVNLAYEIILTLGQAFEVAYQLALQARKGGHSSTLPESFENKPSKPIPKPRVSIRKSVRLWLPSHQRTKPLTSPWPAERLAEVHGEDVPGSQLEEARRTGCGQIDPSEQKTLANLPWIVEPGQEAKRGINTKYETTIF